MLLFYFNKHLYRQPVWYVLYVIKYNHLENKVTYTMLMYIITVSIFIPDWCKQFYLYC